MNLIDALDNGQPYDIPTSGMTSMVVQFPGYVYEIYDRFVRPQISIILPAVIAFMAVTIFITVMKRIRHD